MPERAPRGYLGGYMPVEMELQAKELAQLRGVSLSEFLRELIANEAARATGQPPPANANRDAVSSEAQRVAIAL